MPAACARALQHSLSTLGGNASPADSAMRGPPDVLWPADVLDVLDVHSGRRMAQDHRTCTAGVVVCSAGGPRHACTMGDNTTIIIFARDGAPQRVVGTKTARAMFNFSMSSGTQGPRERKACAGSAQGPPDASPSAQGPLRATFVQSTILPRKRTDSAPTGPPPLLIGVGALPRRRNTASYE